MAFNWFAYIGGDVMLAGNYRLLPGGDPAGAPPNCAGGCVVCAIKIDDNNDTPTTIPGAVRAAIVLAIATQANQPTGDIRVRMKNCPLP